MNRPKYVEKQEPGTQQNEYRGGNPKYRERKEDDDRPYTSDRNNETHYRKPRYVQKNTEENQEHSQERTHERKNYNNNYNTYNNKYKRNTYERDESKIAYYTELPSVPEVKKKKPNEQDHLEKVRKIDQKKNHLKDLRRHEKDSLKNKQSGTFKHLEVVKENITTGEKAEKTLTGDLKKVDQEIREINEKITGLEVVVSKLERKTTRNVDVEKMTVKELDAYIRKIEHRIITQTLDKKKLTELRGQVDKCRRLKIDNKNVDEDDITKEEILHDKQNKLQHMKDIRKKLKNQKHEIEVKLRRIENDLQTLYSEKQALEEEKDEFKSGPEYEKTKQFKEQILKLREEKDKEVQKYEKAVREYAEQQKLIEYVAWATEVKKRKLEEKQVDRANKQKDKMKASKKDGKQAEGGDPKFERPPPSHPYAKEIGYCNFLIQYCEKLKPIENQQVPVSVVEKASINVEQEIKKGIWAKEKGIEVIVPKKRLNADEVVEKKQPRVRERATKQVESNEITHNLEVERLFEQLKLTVPKAKDLTSLNEAISKLNEKKEYYQTNFTAGDRQKEERAYEHDKKPKYKYEEKGGKKEKPNLVLSDFPTLP